MTESMMIEMMIEAFVILMYIVIVVFLAVVTLVKKRKGENGYYWILLILMISFIAQIANDINYSRRVVDLYQIYIDLDSKRVNEYLDIIEVEKGFLKFTSYLTYLIGSGVLVGLLLHLTPKKKIDKKIEC